MNSLTVLSLNNSVKKQYLQNNHGCAVGVKKAIDWFFNNVEYGIIIEDDIQINHNFIDYCNKALITYRDNNSIFTICGSPFLNQTLNNDDLFLSFYPNIWGWATWKRSWINFSLDLEAYSVRELFEVISDTFKNKKTIFFWVLVLLLCKTRRLDTWDHQFYFHIWKSRGYNIIPKRPLTINIGFDFEGNTMKSTPNNLFVNKIYEGNEIIFKDDLIYNYAYDRLVESKIYFINYITITKLIIKLIILKRKPW